MIPQAFFSSAVKAGFSDPPVAAMRPRISFLTSVVDFSALEAWRVRRWEGMGVEEGGKKLLVISNLDMSKSKPLPLVVTVWLLFLGYIFNVRWSSPTSLIRTFSA